MRNLSDATKNAWFFGKLENKENIININVVGI